MKNYIEIEKQYIEEIQSEVTIYLHEKTHARVCCISNDDKNKVFSIAFRTPPINDCGLTHILEHSVLCGSKSFPVKDPFVELLKGSLNTFLNALTYPDKTMYPVASTNKKDFENLMHVYMDAVFYPQIYSHKEIFMQEGWHYHLENIDDPITINGVVYNEMKGAFSDPQEILFSKIMLALFPDTSYHYESGGDPKFIPELSYEEFKEFHSKFYHPSNSYSILYGDCDMEERLSWLDTMYFSKFNAISFDTSLKFQSPFASPKYISYPYPVEKNDTLEDKTFLSYNVVFPSTLDTKLMIASACLVTQLFDVPGAPLKQALIDAKIGQDVSSFFEDGVLQPMLGIIAVNANKEDEERFVSIIENELKKILEDGLDYDALLALLNHAEFQARERAFSSRVPQGLSVVKSILSGWLYDDSNPTVKLHILDCYKELKEELRSGYFENIIKEYLLNNTHKAIVRLEPSYTVGEESERELASKLEAYKNSLSESDLKKLIAECEALKKYQSEGDTEEALASLPKLSLSDISEEPEDFRLEVLHKDYDVLFSDYETNGISYAEFTFNVNHLNTKDVCYASLFADLFKQMSTDTRTFKAINQEIQNEYGSISLGVVPLLHYQTKEALLSLVANVSSLTTKMDAAMELFYDILMHTKYTDEKRLYEYLVEIKTNLEMSIIQRGHQGASLRALSYIEETYYQTELISGIAYMDFISNLVEHFDTEKDTIIAHLFSMRDKLISKQNLTVGFTGTKDDLNSCMKAFDEFYHKLPEKNVYEAEVFEGKSLNEAFTAAVDVNYVSRVGKFDMEYVGGLNVLVNAMSMDYLWMQVRVHGGAYGCMMRIEPAGYLVFTSYRDPNIRLTNDVYQHANEFVMNYNPSMEDLTKLKIGAIGGNEMVLHVRDKGKTARNMYYRGVTLDIRRQNRKSILTITVEELKKYSKLFEEAMKDVHLCVIGNTQKIEEEKELFKTIRPLIQ